MRVGWLVLASSVCACGRWDFASPRTDGGRVRDASTASDSPSLEAGECPAAYAPLGGSCYRVVSAGSPWTTAELACEADASGAHLVAIDDDTERVDVVGNLGLGARTWIGTSKLTGSYRTVTNNAMPYLDLGVQTEPSEDCLSLHADGLMYLHTCGDANSSLCEYDGVPAVASAY